MKKLKFIFLRGALSGIFITEILIAYFASLLKKKIYHGKISAQA